VNGSGFADTILGTNGGEFLNGLGGNDSLFGRDGADTLPGVTATTRSRAGREPTT
jgi:Ca2+-binding RTX toxin-like protein